ncbi:D-cysteine desulfhydrase family protein [Arthrobacter agilis]|uniref:D-cysteine desulfhydrase family protein n=1 Tax=Arthrobacter agilis TaxID=37921 RepID=UPI00278A08AC|nr:D-cysteine desulfhydrase family protein [Arthrobacter agilis]MDQ0736883.1 L-cysteate sulfo-lyase [Arthrobacter agilis]
MTRPLDPPAGSPVRADLGSWPTPLEPAPRLSAALGLDSGDLWIKHDDLIGLGGGGNKVRKLEWTAGTALARGADVLVTSGAAQSNHARLTAAAGARLGVDVVLVLAGEPTPAGNIALDALLGASVHWCGDASDEELATRVQEVADELTAQGRHPGVIPFGGSNALGATGYRRAGDELLRQDPSVEKVVVAVGSGGTMAGLVAALGAERVLGVDTGALPEPSGAVARMVAELTGQPEDGPALQIDRTLLADGYGSVSGDVLEAMHVAARTEGIVLDPTYTARAMAGLLGAVRRGDLVRGQRIVYWHTGGLPGLLGHTTALERIMAG